jgi:NADH dehydrogenase (ubiquinone) Fe-S protein 1
LEVVAFWLNNQYVFNFKNITVLQACHKCSVEIPHFCYHERLNIAGNCRMCLVEIGNIKKLQVSCAISLDLNLEIITNSFRLIRSREFILEFLLLNHPLDCPICDQGGECDLQDLSSIFGNDKSKMLNIKKRVVDDVDCSPLIKTLMTRCIHCTRCVRFLQEVIGDYALGTVGRGNTMEIYSYTQNMLVEEMSGNIIDLCPVGALTAKPFAFVGRS